MPNSWPQKWSRSLKKFEKFLPTREFLKQYLTGKQNGYLQSGRLREVVARKATEEYFPVVLFVILHVLLCGSNF